MRKIGWILLAFVFLFIGYLAYIQMRPMRFVVRHDVITISGNSMEPTLHDGDSFAIRLCNEGKCPSIFRRGDIIVYLQPPIDEEKIKRIVGLPGELVTISQGCIYINHQQLTEPYIASSSSTLSDTSIFQLKHDEYFVLGDNRLFSRDSRRDGPVTHANVIGYIHLNNH
jgi:signal peptidase I